MKVISRVAAALLLSLPMAAGCGNSPTTPTPVVTNLVSLEISCPASLLVGQRRSCFANGHYADGSLRSVTPIWSSSDPNIVSIAAVANAGSVTGRGAGEAVVSSELEGKRASATVSVRAEDFLSVSSAAIQGTFQTGQVVSMWAIGQYGVASADSAELNIEITNQDGTLVVAGTPQAVPRGGDAFVLTSTFTIPPGTTRVCRTAVLQIGATRLTAVGDASIFPCINVTQ